MRTRSYLVLHILLFLNLVGDRLDLDVFAVLQQLRLSVLRAGRVGARRARPLLRLLLGEGGLAALAFVFLSLDAAAVLLIQDEVGPVEGLHRQVQRGGVQKLLGFHLPVGAAAAPAHRVAIVDLPPSLAATHFSSKVIDDVFPTLVISKITSVTVDHVLAVFVQQRVLKLAEVLHGNGVQKGPGRASQRSSQRLSGREGGTRSSAAPFNVDKGFSGIQQHGTCRVENNNNRWHV